MAKTTLSDEHDMFCKEYITDFNATQAYLRVHPETSYNSARVLACRLLARVNVQERVQELMQERSERLQISADDVVKELKEIASAEVEITAKEKMRAIELLGKHLGMFQDW